jgi:hypothetical protein
VKATEFATTADQARELGLKVGDTIQGRKEVAAATNLPVGWHELRITLLWLGKVNTVWIVSGRSDRRPWSLPYESANWDLDTREWERTETPSEHAAFLASLGEGVQP